MSVGLALTLWLSLITAERWQRIDAAYQVALFGDPQKVVALAKSDDPAVRYWAAKAAVYRAAVFEALLHSLRNLVNDADPVVAVSAAAAWARWREPDDEIEQAFRRALRHPQDGVKLEALTYLRGLPELAPRFQAEYEEILRMGRRVRYEVQRLCTELLARSQPSR